MWESFRIPILEHLLFSSVLESDTTLADLLRSPDDVRVSNIIFEEMRVIFYMEEDPVMGPETHMNWIGRH